MKALKICVVLLVITLAGCASVPINSFDYTPPNTKTDFSNKTTVPKPFSLVWDELIRGISTSYFVINNVNKESRIINISFSSSKPSEYVDCGKTSRTYQQGDTREEYKYLAADSSEYKFGEKPHGDFVRYTLWNRKVSLEGRTNIYIAPSRDINSTDVDVNTRYMLKVTVKPTLIFYHWLNPTLLNTRLQTSESHIMSFNTYGTGVSDDGSMSCVSKGKIEKDLLSLVSRVNSQ